MDDDNDEYQEVKFNKNVKKLKIPASEETIKTYEFQENTIEVLVVVD